MGPAPLAGKGCWQSPLAWKLHQPPNESPGSSCPAVIPSPCTGHRDAQAQNLPVLLEALWCLPRRPPGGLASAELCACWPPELQPHSSLALCTHPADPCHTFPRARGLCCYARVLFSWAPLLLIVLAISVIIWFGARTLALSHTRVEPTPLAHWWTPASPQAGMR